jgi:hypothetical protein
VAFFYAGYYQHHHFVWDFAKKEITGKKNVLNSTIIMELDCSRKNFPLKCFFNEEYDEILVFYRQGESFRMSIDDIEQYEFEDITDADLG